MLQIEGYGTASVKISSGEAELFFDPFLKMIPAGYEKQELALRRSAAFEHARHVLITHGHFDHIYSVAALYRESDAVIYCTRAPARTLLRHGLPPEHIRLLRPGDAFSIESLQIRTFHARHCRFDHRKVEEVLFHHRMLHYAKNMLRLLRLNLCYRAKDECLLYEISDGSVRAQLLGSAGLDRSVVYPTGADALILPYQGRSDMAEYCLSLVEMLRPKAVILDHYDDAFVPMSTQEDVAPFLALMQRAHPEIPCCALTEHSSLTIGTRRAE